MKLGVITNVFGELRQVWDPTSFDFINDALVLARLPRFAGRTTCEWSVAQHLLLCGDLLPFVAPDAGAAMRFAVESHDVAEAYGFGDIPTPMKSLLLVRDSRDGVWNDGYITLDAWEDRVRYRWLASAAPAYDFAPLFDELDGIVHTMDRLALWAEGEVVTRRPPGAFGGVAPQRVRHHAYTAIAQLRKYSPETCATLLSGRWVRESEALRGQKGAP